MKKLRDKVNNDIFLKHWAVPCFLLCQGPYEHYRYRSLVKTFLKDHWSFWFLVMCLQHFLAGKIISS